VPTEIEIAGEENPAYAGKNYTFCARNRSWRFVRQKSFSDCAINMQIGMTTAWSQDEAACTHACRMLISVPYTQD